MPQHHGEDEPASNISLTLSRRTVVLDLNSAESQELLLSASGYSLPDEYTFRYERKGNCFSCRWTGDWNGDSHPVTFYGYREGSGSVIFYLIDSESGESLASVELEVQVVSETQEGSVENNAQVRVSTNNVKLNFLYDYYKIVTITAIDDVSERSSSLVVETSTYDIGTVWYSDWKNNSIDLAIYGSRSGTEGIVTVSIVDDDTDETLASTVITVSVE